MRGHNLAQINIGRLIASLGDPRIAGFVAQLEPINQLGRITVQALWRLQSAQANATDLPYNDDPSIMVNMSVWESIEALKEFTYKSQHMGVFRDRRKWFQKMDLPHCCLWWVPLAIFRALTRAERSWNTTSAMGRRPNRSGFPSRSLRRNWS